MLVMFCAIAGVGCQSNTGGLDFVADQDADTSARSDAHAARDGSTADDAAVALVPSCPTTNQPLPILPCGDGYGMETVAGSGRHLDPPQASIMQVTNLNASGPGSLRSCMEGSGPRTCVFAVSGVIELTDDLQIREPYITVAGQTAPPPGVSIHGAGIRIRASDVLVQHLRIRVGDRPGGPPTNDRDAIAIVNSSDPPERIVIDHCSLAFSSDEMLSVWFDAGDITIVDSIMGYPLHDSIHVDEGATTTDPHGYGPLFGEWGARVYLARSLLAHMFRRNPRSLTKELVFANNVVLNWGALGLQMLSQNQTTSNTVVGNAFLPGADTLDRKPILVTPVSGSKVFLEDNSLDGSAPSEAWDLAEVGTDGTRVDTPPTSLVPETVSVERVPQQLEQSVGAWPGYRDAVDAALAEQVAAGGGQIINCVEPDGSARCMKNAGGWPTLRESRRDVAVPPNPFGDDSGDGYTNLENWMHVQSAMAAGATR